MLYRLNDLIGVPQHVNTITERSIRANWRRETDLGAVVYWVSHLLSDPQVT